MDRPDMEMDFEPVILASVDAEQSVLGALLLDNQAWDVLDGILVPEDFYRHDHRLIFGEIAAMLGQSRPADVITVFEALKASGRLEEAGGLPYINSLAQTVPSSANVRRYAEIVHGFRVRRDVAGLGHRIAALADDLSTPVSEIVDDATRQAMGLVDTQGMGEEPHEMGALLTNFLSEIEVRSARDGGISGLSSGFADLDQQTSGLHDGDLIIIAGRPSMGKTTLGMNIAENVANAGGVAMVVSLEMSAGQLIERTVARFGAINTQALRSGRLAQGDWSNLTASISRIHDKNLIIADDTRLAAVSRLRLAARKVKQKHGRLDLLMIDYLQLMRSEGNNRNEELGSITRALKLLARELGCPIILLSQLSRAVEQRPNKRPMMSDLRESGAIEQDADVVLMCYRDDYYNPDSPFAGYAEILIRKQRMGPLGEVHMVFQGQFSRFLDADPTELAHARNAAPAPKKAIYSLKD